MSLRALASAALVAVLAFAASADAAQAASSGPPPPQSTNGQAVELVASGLKTPTSFAFGGGSVFEGDGGNSEGNAPPNGGVYVLQSGAATEIAGSPQFVGGLAWHDNSLYVSGGVVGSAGVSWQIDKWSGWNGKAFSSQTAVYTAPKGLDGLNGLGFGADGRLFVGVDVGLTDNNDHGPASKSPYLYDILSMTAEGKGVTVFAKGIRQPWQFAFPAGSSSPFVTDLGQDKGAKNPPDFILRVSKGQQYGFPKCNHTSARACTKDATPFERFKPHTDPMGIAIEGDHLYLTSFAGPAGKGPGGEVFSLPLHGGKLKPLVTGFVAPTVGLGVAEGYLYVGELTGEVFRVKI